MTKIEILCHDDKVIVADVANYNAEDLAEKINSHQIQVLAVGETIINKNIIKTIKPIEEQE